MLGLRLGVGWGQKVSALDQMSVESLAGGGPDREVVRDCFQENAFLFVRTDGTGLFVEGTAQFGVPPQAVSTSHLVGEESKEHETLAPCRLKHLVAHTGHVSQDKRVEDVSEGGWCRHVVSRDTRGERVVGQNAPNIPSFLSTDDVGRGELPKSLSEELEVAQLINCQKFLKFSH